MVENHKVSIKSSRLNGKGLFANSPIKKGDKFLHIKGEILSLQKFYKLPQRVKDNTYRFSSKEYLSPKGEHGDYLNHSCLPNSKVVKQGRRIYLIAIKNIIKGSEILIDYSTILAKDDYWVMGCNCKTKNCRKKIKRFDSMPESTLKKYIKECLIPSYILDVQ